mmetsp:Transcript_14711/g.44440  ORF Transcript_14711/g.44440 Transcript_14711/m.44440 type:complete len:187 (-) Transcript_14711:4155-4715(-)
MADSDRPIEGDECVEGGAWRRRLANLSAQFSSAKVGVAERAGSITSVISRLATGQAAAMVVHPDVAKALRERRAVVALESTIVCHGMPYPQNLQTANEVEDVVRDGGAVPATIAILEGVPHIGLTAEQLQHLARSGAAVAKVSRRDIAAVVARRGDGATTVSATMILAARAGINVFVTGGSLTTPA